MEPLVVVIALLAGLLCGAVAVWLLLRGRTEGAEAALRETAAAKAEATSAKAEASEARLEAANARTEAANARSEAAGARAEAAKADTDVERARVEVAEARAGTAEARESAALALAEVASLKALVSKAEAERDAAVARAVELAADRESVVTQFKVLSSEALEHQGKAAEASAEQRLKATELLMAPVRESLERFESRLTEVEKERAVIAAELKQQVLSVQLTGEQLKIETTKLTTALRKPHVRGAWGEMQLRRVVELSGMVEHCDFTEQASAATDERQIRPDLKVSMAAERFVYVDSKVPLSGFLDAQDAADAEAKARALGMFAKNVRGHVDALAGKQYWKAEETGATPEFVVMFMPSEALFAEAIARMPDLLEHAAARGVVLTTPSTLIGLLRAIAYGWKQAALAESAREVSALGRQLYDRLGTMGGHVDKLGRALGTAVRAYNDSVGALESRVFVAARRFRDLQVSEAELKQPDQVELTVRTLAAPELVEDAAQVEPMIGRGSRRALPATEADLLQRTTPEVDELALFDVTHRGRGQGVTGEAAQG